MKLKLIAIAAAMISLAGAAQADLTPTTSNNGSLTLVAVDITTNNWYIRDTGFLLNDFLPSSVTTLSGDGSVTGNKTPEAGLTLDKTNTASFADASFGTWLAAQSGNANIRWQLGAYDNVGTQTTTNVKRMIASTGNAAESIQNSNIDTYISSGSRGGLVTLWDGGGTTVLSPVSRSGGGAAAGFLNAFGLGTDAMSMLDTSASLFYAARSPATGSTTIQSDKTRYGNSLNFASVALESDGDFSYSLAPAAAVPLPATVWMMGAGLVAVGGVIRRRKAAAQA